MSSIFLALSPVDARRLQALFERDETGHVVLLSGESDEVEIKQSFHRPLHDRFLRAVAALANNRGGYVLFGVDDNTGRLAGLSDQRFKSADPSEFAMAIRSAMEPCPRFEIGTAENLVEALGQASGLAGCSSATHTDPSLHNEYSK